MPYRLNPFTNNFDEVGTSTNPLPTGGTTGQVLSKASNTDYDTVWATAAGGGGETISSFLLMGA